MFICQADVMLGQYQEHMPELFAIIKTLEQFWERITQAVISSSAGRK